MQLSVRFGVCILAVIWPVVGLQSCGSQQVCTPGETQLCNGPGACQGSQICNADGTAFGNCDCGNTSTGGAGGSGVQDGGTAGNGAPGGSGGTVSTGGAGGSSGTAGAGGQPTSTCGNSTVDPGEVCFDLPYVDYQTFGNDHRDLVLVDCNGDTYLDIITVDYGSDSVTALQNDNLNPGTFAFPTSTGVGTQPVAIAAGQLDGLYGEDLVVANETINRITVLKAKSSPPCEYESYFTLDLAAEPNDVTLVDINNDGNLDIVATTATPYHIAYWINGTAHTVTQVASGGDPRGIRGGKLDDDNFADIVYASDNDEKIYVHLSTGSGLGPAQGFPTTALPYFGLRDVAVGSLTGNGILDVVTVSRNDNVVCLFQNDGYVNLSYQSPGLSVQGPPGSVGAHKPERVVVGDMNADGSLDIVTVNTDTPYSVSLLLNQGAHQFALATQANFPQLSVPESFPIETGSYAKAVEVADLNKDGAMDIATCGTIFEVDSSYVSVILANP